MLHVQNVVPHQSLWRRLLQTSTKAVVVTKQKTALLKQGVLKVTTVVTFYVDLCRGGVCAVEV